MKAHRWSTGLFWHRAWTKLGLTDYRLLQWQFTSIKKGVKLGQKGYQQDVLEGVVKQLMAIIRSSNKIMLQHTKQKSSSGSDLKAIFLFS